MNSLGTNSVGSLPIKEQPNDLIITNHVALDKENSPRPLTPVIRVWEGDFEVVEPNQADTATQFPTPLVSYTAWEEESQQESTESASNPNFTEKATSMAHELVHLMTKNGASDNEGSDIELEDIVKSINPKTKTKVDKQTLLMSNDGEGDENDGDEVELHRLTSLDDRPSFEDSHLVFHHPSSPTPEFGESEGNVTENVYRREDSVPVIIEQTDVPDCENVLRNPSYSDEPLEVTESSVSRRSSARSTTSGHSRKSKEAQDEMWEMKQLNVEQSVPTSSEAHEETGLLASNEETLQVETSLQGRSPLLFYAVT